MKIINAKITGKKQVAKDHFEVRLEVPWAANEIRAGQFITIQTQSISTSPLLKLPLAIHDIHQNSITVLFRVVGPKTKSLCLKQVGEKVEIMGPLGNGFTINNKTENTILVVGGSGIPPLYLLAKQINSSITLFIGAATKDQLLCLDKFANLNANIYASTDDGSYGKKGFVTEALHKYLTRTNPKSSFIYSSGPEQMLQKVKSIAEAFNIPGQLSFESYMACGIGVCRGCNVATKNGYKLCCKDGPIFDISD